MPELTKLYTLRVTPEEFVRNCSDVELVELWMELNRAEVSERLTKCLAE